MGPVKQESIYQKSPSETFTDVRAIISAIGRLNKKTGPNQNFVVGYGTYGSQKVRLSIKIEPNASGSLLSIKAWGDDIWGHGAKKVIEQFESYLQTTAAGGPLTIQRNAIPGQGEVNYGRFLLALFARLLVIAGAAGGAGLIGIEIESGEPRWYMIALGVVIALTVLAINIWVIRFLRRERPRTLEDLAVEEWNRSHAGGG